MEKVRIFDTRPYPKVKYQRRRGAFAPRLLKEKQTFRSVSFRVHSTLANSKVTYQISQNRNGQKSNESACGYCCKQDITRWTHFSHQQNCCRQCSLTEREAEVTHKRPTSEGNRPFVSLTLPYQKDILCYSE